MEGKTINGYTIQRFIGVGGMAEVWMAENKLGKKAAVKLLLPKLCGKENVEARARFYTEAKVMVDLKHPNIRQVQDYGELEGRPVIVMEFLDGEDLKTRMKRGQRFTDEELTRWWNQMVSALNYTHQQGIVHRDIKPGNLFVNKDGNLKLMDFGIAKVRGSISDTMTGQQLGTLMYMSPEQVKDSKNVDYHTDIYSLAVTFVHLITGKKPYNSDTSSDFEICEQIVYESLDLSGVPPKWRDVLTPYLAKDPKQRPDLKPLDAFKKPDEPEPKPKPVEPNTAPEGDDDDGTIDDSTPSPKPGSTTPKQPRPSAAPRPSPTPKPATGTNKGLSKGVIIGLVIVVVALGGALGGLLYHQNESKKKSAEMERERAERFYEAYNTNLSELDRNLGNMVLDKENKIGNDLFIVLALDCLQKIEGMENGPSFKNSGLRPCFSNKFDKFKSNLREAESLLTQEIRGYEGENTEGDGYYMGLCERRELIQNLLRQSEGSNSSLGIPKPRPKNATR